MTDSTTTKKVKSEIRRLKNLMIDLNVSDNKIKVLTPIIENTSVMKVKLDETKDLIEKSNVVIPYDNGGGQKGLRENPIFKGYEALWKSYIQGMDKIMSCIPDCEEKIIEVEKPKTMLEIVRARKQA